ncbi:MAG TPA: hypothetical protein PLQ11_00845 [Beijerinckiaceae bacterium]|nr:hypothetical protein [Beijerinckiaceae bacterium]
MKKIALGLLLAGLAATAAHSADQRLLNAEIANLVAGKQVFMGGGYANFGKDRSFNFSGLFTGKWRATNRQICLVYDLGGTNCYPVVRNGKAYFILDNAGNRFPVK